MGDSKIDITVVKLTIISYKNSGTIVIIIKKSIAKDLLTAMKIEMPLV